MPKAKGFDKVVFAGTCASGIELTGRTLGEPDLAKKAFPRCFLRRRTYDRRNPAGAPGIL